MNLFIRVNNKELFYYLFGHSFHGALGPGNFWALGLTWKYPISCEIRNLAYLN